MIDRDRDGDRDRIGRRAAVVLLAAVVAGASALAGRWAFLVPVYQSPDEMHHLDYALALRDGGRFFRAVPIAPGTIHRGAHPWSNYLQGRTAADTVAHNPSAKVPPGYGTRRFFRDLDRDAPPRGSIRIDRPPTLAVVYPYGYYLALAGWLELVGLFSDRVSVAFFAARLFSVGLLAVGLVAGYLAARELRVGRGTALAATAIVGFFPLTTFVASYVQPDNLAFALVSLGLYQALLAARRGGPALDLAALGLCWGALLVTKPHFFACLVAASLPLLATRIRPRRWPLAIALLAWPSLPLWSIFSWIVRDCPSFYSRPEPASDFLVTSTERLGKALDDFFRGTTHMSFWGVYGWLDAPLEIATPRRLIVAVRFLAMAGTWAVLGLTLMRMERVGSRLARVAARGRWRSAARVAASDPVLNGYFLFFALMVYAYVRMDNRFGAQGRNWLPVMLGIVLTTIRYAPRALTLPAARRVASAGLTLGLVAYLVVGAVYSYRTIEERFFLASRGHALRKVPLPVVPAGVHRMTWDDGKGDTQGPDSYLSFALAGPERVRGLEIRYVVDNPEHKPAAFRVVWANTRDPHPAPRYRGHHVNLPADATERVLIVPIQDTMDMIRIDPDTARACHVEIRSLTLHQPNPRR